ncbi:MAG: TspO/MBR family protein [Pyrinomonadaceae bacterium]
MKLHNASKLIIAVLVCQLAGGIGAVVTAPAITGWYATLKKPALHPAGWVFGPVWITLYFLMGVAAFLIWRKGLDVRGVRAALGIFIGQLVLNSSWSLVFFGLHNPRLALVSIDPPRQVGKPNEAILSALRIGNFMVRPYNSTNEEIERTY